MLYGILDMASMDIEKGMASATTRTVIPSWASSVPENTAIESSHHTPLKLFQLLVGIHTPPSLTQDDGVDLERGTKKKSKRGRSDNAGLYACAKQQERTARLQYQATSFISNSLFMVQIMLAATFTALSAYKDSHPVTLTVLGAANTVIAGCLAWQKGQGVPQRYRKAMDQYQALIFEIEMAERSFLGPATAAGESGAMPDPRAEKERLQKLYDTARADQQANYPDLYVSTGAKESKDSAKALEEAKAETTKVRQEMVAKIEELLAKLAGKVEEGAEGVVKAVAKT